MVDWDKEKIDKKKMTRVSFYMPVELKIKIDTLARSLGISSSKVVGLALSEELK